MAGWTRLQGQAVALPVENIDTDQLIPARFMATPRSQGYGRSLLHDMRFDADGTPIAAMPLNRHADVAILVTRRNFGGGSSREAAVYALADFGIRAVVAPSFGDIFAANAVNNGLLPARVHEREAEALIAQLGEAAQPATIDLATCEIAVGPARIAFTLDPVWRTKLINGWDDIDLTASHGDAIASFRAARRRQAGWTWPGAWPGDGIETGASKRRR